MGVLSPWLKIHGTSAQADESMQCWLWEVLGGTGKDGEDKVSYQDRSFQG